MRKPLLWEWLVCLGIVFCLVGVFVPITACGCSEASPGTHCLSNSKQIALSLIIYAADYDERLPDRDAWMDLATPYTKNQEIFVDPEIRVKGQHGYAFDSRLSRKKTDQFQSPATQSMIYDSINLARNASDPFASLPNPGRHKGRNSIGYLDGHVKRVALPKTP
ncbi:MAG: hypothetical protein H7Y17_04175 [Chlorobia bacterium]|nr:hypothetical protein [Fimbriimonadaceae bacterium]